MTHFQNEFTPEDCLGRTLFCGTCGTLSLQEEGKPSFKIPVKVFAMPRFTSQSCDINGVEAEFFPPLFDIYTRGAYVKAVLTLPIYNAVDHSTQSATKVGNVVYEYPKAYLSRLVTCTKDQSPGPVIMQVHETMSFDLEQYAQTSVNVSFLKTKEAM